MIKLWMKSNSAQFVKYAKISFEIQFEEKFGAARTPGAPSPQTRQIQVTKSQNNMPMLDTSCKISK